MAVSKLLIFFPALMLLAACGEKGAQTAAEPAAAEAADAAEAPAAGKAEEGRFSIKGPGFDMQVNIPEGLANRGSASGENDLLYPGAAVSGMHIEARPKNGAGPNSGVELRFTTGDPFDKVADWYRDPARASGFRVTSATREGDALLLSGTQKGGSDLFSLRLSPGRGGGTEGRLTLSDGG